MRTPDREPAIRELHEVKLFPPVKAWLVAQGFKVFAEVWGHDVVAIRDDELVVVELKMSFTRRLWSQCGGASTLANRVYAATPTKARNIPEYCVDIGILHVGEAVTVIRESKCKPWPPQRERAIAALRDREPDESVIGGCPTLKGEGPAQRCDIRCAAYIAEHPTATWKELFAKVHNHYAHHRSMAQAMGGSYSMNRWRAEATASACTKIVEQASIFGESA